MDAPLIASTVAAQTTALNSVATPLTAEVLRKLLDLVAQRGVDREAPATIANPLGLSAAGQNWPSRQIAAHETRPGYLHGFAINRGNDQDLVLTIRGPDKFFAYRAGRDGRAISAIVFDLQTRQVTMRSPIVAQADIDSELRFWAEGVRVWSEK